MVALFGLKRVSYISAAAARNYLQKGALVVDVRNAVEFRGGHLPGAVNIPLDALKVSLPERIKDKNQVLLLHCLSGTRSAFGRRILKGIGYQNVFNLGSYGRAAKILGHGQAN